MEQYLQEYARWQKQELPEDLAAELALARKDEGELQDRFCRVMRFGTSGLRAGVRAQRDPLLSLRGADTGSGRIVRDTAARAEWRRYDHRKSQYQRI